MQHIRPREVTPSVETVVPVLCNGGVVVPVSNFLETMSEKTKPEKLIDVAINTLEKVNKPMTPKQIWVMSEKLGTQGEYASKSQTPVNSLYTVIRSYIETHGDAARIYRVSSEPITYFLTGRKSDVPKKTGDLQNNENPDDINQTKSILIRKQKQQKHDEKERSLYPLLRYFVSNHRHFRAWTKAIPHHESKHAGAGTHRWRFPDIVGVRFPFDDIPTILTIHKRLAADIVKLYSFEMKWEVKLGNLRESYFQAVSNSSWAHEGYLVVLNMNIEEDGLVAECRRLNKAFGIGIIKLGIKSDSDSKPTSDSDILFYARSKDIADWDTMDSLASINDEFHSFLKSVENATAITKVIQSEFDTVMTDDEEMTKYIETEVSKFIPKQ